MAGVIEENDPAFSATIDNRDVAQCLVRRSYRGSDEILSHLVPRWA